MKTLLPGKNMLFRIVAFLAFVLPASLLSSTNLTAPASPPYTPTWDSEEAKEQFKRWESLVKELAVRAKSITHYIQWEAPNAHSFALIILDIAEKDLSTPFKFPSEEIFIKSTDIWKKGKIAPNVTIAPPTKQTETKESPDSTTWSALRYMVALDKKLPSFKTPLLEFSKDILPTSNEITAYQHFIHHIDLINFPEEIADAVADYCWTPQTVFWAHLHPAYRKSLFKLAHEAHRKITSLPTGWAWWRYQIENIHSEAWTDKPLDPIALMIHTARVLTQGLDHLPNNLVNSSTADQANQDEN